jgi:hypothetical protein
MNYLPFVGYWFYGATTVEERASFFNSWGLLEIAPIGAAAYILVAEDGAYIITGYDATLLWAKAKLIFVEGGAPTQSICFVEGSAPTQSICFRKGE